MALWLLALLDCVLLAGAVYAPGYLALRACGVRKTVSLGLAPFVSVAFLYVLTSLYNGVIPANYLTLCMVPLVVCACAYAVKHVRGRTAIACPVFTQNTWLYVAYVVFALLVFLLVYVRVAGSADNFAWLVDNGHHLGVSEALTQKTNWSIFAPGADSYYALGVDPLGEGYTQAGGFYPPLWQWLVALPKTLIAQNIAVTETAAIAFVSVIVLPTSFFCLMQALFATQKKVLIAGVPMACAFVSCPWLLCVWGPLYPNLVAYALVPAGVLAFLCATTSSHITRAKRALYAGIFVLACFTEVLGQPNGLIVLGVFLAPYLVWLISRIPRAFLSAKVPVVIRACVRVAFGVLATLAICGIWAYLITRPFMADATNFDWPKFVTGDVALPNVLTLHLGVGYVIGAGAQYVLASCVLVGFVAALCNRKLRWLAISYLAFCVLYYIAINNDIRDTWWITGFWYNDSFRLSPTLALAGAPLAAYGFALFCSGLRASFANLVACHKKATPAPAHTLKPYLAVLAVVALANYWISPLFSPAKFSGAYPIVSAYFPDNDYPMSYPFQRMEFLVARSVNPQYMSRVAQKREFMAQVASITQDAWVANCPIDGSVFAYPTTNMQTLIRSAASAPQNNDVVRELAANLDNLATNQELATTLYNLDVEYVMRLEDLSASRTAFLQIPNDEEWRGFMQVNSDTPGFEEVLSQDGMHLFKICWDQIPH